MPGRGFIRGLRYPEKNYCTCRYGWGWNKFVDEANEGKGLKIAKWMRPYMTFVLPVIIISLFVLGIVNFFA